MLLVLMHKWKWCRMLHILDGVFYFGFVQYLNMFLFACPPDSTNVGDNRENAYMVEEVDVKIIDSGLHFYFLFSLYFIFIFIFILFAIFRTTQVRVYQSRCHNLMAKVTRLITRHGRME